MYWATTAELQSAIPAVPDEYSLKTIAFVDPAACFAPLSKAAYDLVLPLRFSADGF